MDYFPVYLYTKNKPCLIIGGGTIAWRKAKLLLQAKASIDVIAPEITTALQQLVLHSGGQCYYRLYRPEEVDVRHYILVIAATSDLQVNQQVSAICHQHHIPVNVVDNPALCSFIVPAIINRSPILIAVSSSGVAPVLSRLIRSKIESLIPHAYGRLASLIIPVKKRIRRLFPDTDTRRYFLESVFQGHIAELVLQHKEKAAHALLGKQLDQLEQTDCPVPVNQGEVYIVGAGPGDPDLLTFKALRCMQQADVVLYDQLVSEAIISLTRRDATLIAVGKKAGCPHSTKQQDIHQLMLEYARTGKRILRLKGGDPFIFGRGGEEVDFLVQHQIPFQVIPGITAALGCAAYANIALTHREDAHSVRFLTVSEQALHDASLANTVENIAADIKGHVGHATSQPSSIDWPGLVQPKQTLVFYMSMMHLERLANKLLQVGMAPDMPLAVIVKGTLPEQQNYITSLAGVPDLLRQEIDSPSLIIIGQVVKRIPAQN